MDTLVTRSVEGSHCLARIMALRLSKRERHARAPRQIFKIVDPLWRPVSRARRRCVAVPTPESALLLGWEEKTPSSACRYAAALF
jgi:hypothetical protein